MSAQPTGTVTLLFSDVEGSTTLLQRLGTDGYAAVLDLHRCLLREAFDRHGGYEVDYEGDSFFVAFASASEAVAAAAEAQRALAKAEWPEQGAICVRIGIHTGEPQPAPPKYVGLDVHKAARVMAAGHGGQVLLTRATRELVGPEVAVRELGEHRLKDLLRAEPLYQLCVPGLRQEFPALTTLGNRPNNLPIVATPFIGREEELEAVEDLLLRDEVRLLTLTGPGGIGKTRLALQAAANESERFPDGVYWVPFAPLREAHVVASTLAQTLGLREEADEPAATTLARFLADKELLLVLDNLEHVVIPARDLVATILRTAPGVRVLTTSREALRLSGEHLYDVPPLALPKDARHAEQTDATQLFVARAEAADPTFELTASTVATVVEIVRRLEGLPLAIELAAARVRALPPAALLERLDDRLRLLTTGAHDADERQRTLRATIEWSYDLLTEDEQTLFARLSVFFGGCRLEAAETVCGTDRDARIAIVDGLTSLIDKSLLRRRDDPDGHPRYWMLETIREFASERLQDVAELDSMRTRHSRYFAALAQEFEREWHRPDREAASYRFDSEIANIRQSIAWLRTTGLQAEALDAAASLTWLWQTRGRAAEGYDLIEACLADAGAPEGAMEHGRVLCGLGVLALELGRLEQGLDWLAQAVRVLQAGDRKDLLTVALSMQAGVLNDIGRHGEAIEAAREAEAVARSDGNPALILRALNEYAQILAAGGDLEAAATVWEELVAMGAPAGSGNRATTLMNLCETKIALGDLTAARGAVTEGIELVERYGLVRERPALIATRALLNLLETPPDVDRAKIDATDAIADYRARGDQVHLSMALIVLAAAEAALGNASSAQSSWAEAMSIRSATGFVLELATERLLIDHYLPELAAPTAPAAPLDEHAR